MGDMDTLATAAWAWPALMRLKAGSDIMEFVGIIPQCAQYEAQSALLDDRIYAILRGSKGDNFLVSDNRGKHSARSEGSSSIPPGPSS